MIKTNHHHLHHISAYITSLMVQKYLFRAEFNMYDIYFPLFFLALVPLTAPPWSFFLFWLPAMSDSWYFTDGFFARLDFLILEGEPF
jgi:hypothetical protein